MGSRTEGAWVACPLTGMNSTMFATGLGGYMWDIQVNGLGDANGYYALNGGTAVSFNYSIGMTDMSPLLTYQNSANVSLTCTPDPP